MRVATPAITTIGYSWFPTGLVKKQLEWKLSRALNLSEKYGPGGLAHAVTNRPSKENANAKDGSSPLTVTATKLDASI